MNEFVRKKLIKTCLTVAGSVIIVYTSIYIDVLMRARSAYLEGEKYWAWHENPKMKQDALNKIFDEEKTKLDNKLSKNKISKEEYDTQLKIFKFNRDRKLEESSIKYAYIWYQTVIELFSPPQSKWVKLAKIKMPIAKDIWKKELKSKNILFEDYMLE